MLTQNLITLLIIVTTATTVISFIACCINKSFVGFLWILWECLIIALVTLPKYCNTEEFILSIITVTLIFIIFVSLAMRYVKCYPYTNFFLVIFVAFLILTLAATIICLILFLQNCKAFG